MKSMLVGVKALVVFVGFMTLGYGVGAAIGAERPIIGGLGGSMGALWYFHFLHTDKQEPPDSQKG